MESTTMISVGYDPEMRTLEIEFTGGTIYQYLNVPELFFQGLLAAESKGRYFNLVIKPYGFKYRKR
ncbi:MAG TPA: KTSC domain-containing protein [Anaerolineales bacterium]|nr:KTSC domain-containing protein [Anaerolineales bacterium]